MDWTLKKMRDDGVPLMFVDQFFLHHGNAILAKVSRSPLADSTSAAKIKKEK